MNQSADKVIVMTGGGSGGHITPILAVAEAVKSNSPSTKVVYIGQKGDKLGDIPAEHPAIDEVKAVRAGKFRRYHGEGLKQLLDVPTFLKNVRDFFYVIAGYFQSLRLLKRLKPDVVFVKGGFVGVPVGLAAASLKIPYVTHDSDAIPGLANRIIAKWAKMHAVAMPKETYHYPADKTITTGIPLQKNFQPVTPELKAQYRRDLGIPEDAKVLFVVGGGLGSQRINQAVVQCLPQLLQKYPNLHVLHIVGRNNQDELQSLYKGKFAADSSRVYVYGYLSDIFRYSGAADVVITRAGATNLAEFALQGKAAIVVPSPFLTGGHQLKNADLLAREGAVEVLPEDQLIATPTVLAEKVSGLLDDSAKCAELGSAFSALAVPDAAGRLAGILLSLDNKEVAN